jgi:hypothetical protein
VTLKNAGLSKLPLNEKMKIIRLLGMLPGDYSYPSSTKWKRISTLPILKQHSWLEAQESVSDVITYNLGSVNGVFSNHAAYRVEAVVGSPRRRITGKGTRWQAHAVIFSQPSHSAKMPGVITRFGRYRLFKS